MNPGKAVARSHRNPSLWKLESASNLNSQHSANWLTAKLINGYSHAGAEARVKGPESRLQPVYGHWLTGAILKGGEGGLPPSTLLVHLGHSPQAPEAESFKHKQRMGQLFSALQSKLTQRDQGLQWEGRRGGRGQRIQHREGDGPARMTESKGEAARSGDGQ